jgi:2-polyprenyl-3-methyl-5-hydroxy-6-metoxy-1,4-benzoquinol methylase
MKNANITNAVKFKLLPEIKGNISDISTILSKNDIARLLNHDSMKVYYNIHLENDTFRLSELPTTTARAELILPAIKKIINNQSGDVSVLDIACSPGYFMFKIADLGVKTLTGVDARQDHADQFNLLNHFYGYENINFVHSDMYTFLEDEIAKGNKYDICLLFGFLYHTSTPVELLRLIRKICNNCLIIDTTLNFRDDKSIHIYEENTEWSRASTSKVSFTPSFHAVPLMTETAGFIKTQFIKPSEELKLFNPGGDNINYYFHTDLNPLRLIQGAVNKLSYFPRLKRLQKITAKLTNNSIKIGSRRAFYIAYV